MFRHYAHTGPPFSDLVNSCPSHTPGKLQCLCASPVPSCLRDYNPEKIPETDASDLDAMVSSFPEPHKTLCAHGGQLQIMARYLSVPPSMLPTLG
jgi:hypothetical protein